MPRRQVVVSAWFAGMFVIVGWLGSVQPAAAQVQRYVAAAASGDGSGSSAANAAAYTNTAFWNGVQTSLVGDAVTVTFLDGQYTSSLVLTQLGHADHRLTLQSQSVGGAVFAGHNWITLRGVQNATVRDFGFTGGDPDGSARKLHITSSNNLATGIPSQNILIEGNQFYDAPTFYGGIGVTHLTHYITIHDNLFRNVGSRAGSHMIYNSYDVHHVKVIGNHFEDSPGDYVRYRDNSDFGEVRNNTFVSTSAGYNLIFVRLAVFNDVNPGDEFHASNYLIRDNEFLFHPEPPAEAQDAIGYTSTGYEPVGLNYLPSAADGQVLTNGTVEQKRQLLLDTMNIDLTKVRIYGNTYANERYRFMYWARVDYGASSQGWTGRADLTGTASDTYLGAGDVYSDAVLDEQDVALFLLAVEAADEWSFLLDNRVWFGDYGAADLNGDGIVDARDAQPFVDLFAGRVSEETLAPVRALIPEPGTAMLMAGAAYFCVARRRQR